MSERSKVRADLDARVRDINARLGAWMRQQRHARGLTQRQLAQLLDVTHQQVGRYESAATGLGAAQLLVLLAELQLDLGTLAAELFADLPPHQDRSGHRLLARVARLGRSQRRGVLAMLEATTEDTPRSWLTPELVAC